MVYFNPLFPRFVPWYVDVYHLVHNLDLKLLIRKQALDSARKTAQNPRVSWLNEIFD